jgi:hypothetical protein
MREVQVVSFWNAKMVVISCVGKLGAALGEAPDVLA